MFCCTLCVIIELCYVLLYALCDHCVVMFCCTLCVIIELCCTLCLIIVLLCFVVRFV